VIVIPFSKESFEKLQEFIYRKSGIALEHDKHFEKMEKIFNRRCAQLSLDSFRKYYYRLRFEDQNGEEFQELINNVTVNETYFFRESYQFDTLVQSAIPELHRKKHSREPLRILTAPSSTGEETYSIALYLLEDNTVINERDVEIVGIDIDTNAIEKAKKGQFSDRSVHAIPKPVREKYFKRKGLFNNIDEGLREAMTFQVCNVFDKQQLRRLGKFDVIFSRNMLIYFDDASKKEVAMHFYEMLNPGGFIFLGHAEYMNRITSVFQPRKHGSSLYYQK